MLLDHRARTRDREVAETRPCSAQRSISNNFHAFAAHSFADEMAQAARRDSLEFLLDMLGPGKTIDLKSQGVEYSNYGVPIEKYPIDTRRLRRVLEVAAEKSAWGKLVRELPLSRQKLV